MNSRFSALVGESKLKTSQHTGAGLHWCQGVLFMAASSKLLSLTVSGLDEGLQGLLGSALPSSSSSPYLVIPDLLEKVISEYPILSSQLMMRLGSDFTIDSGEDNRVGGSNPASNRPARNSSCLLPGFLPGQGEIRRAEDRSPTLLHVHAPWPSLLRAPGRA